MSHPDRPDTILNQFLSHPIQHAHETWESFDTNQKIEKILRFLTDTPYEQLLTAQYPNNTLPAYYQSPLGVEPWGIAITTLRNVSFLSPVCNTISEKTAKQLIMAAYALDNLLTQNPSLLPDAFTMTPPGPAVLDVLTNYTFNGKDLISLDTSVTTADRYVASFAEAGRTLGPAGLIGEGVQSVMLSFIQLIASDTSILVPDTSGSRFTPDNMSLLIEAGLLNILALALQPALLAEAGRSGMCIENPYYIDENGELQCNRALFKDMGQDRRNNPNRNTGALHQLTPRGCPLGRKLPETNSTGIDIYARFFVDVFRIIYENNLI
jgi:hypothetical protein